jgi:hypothetical protein
LIFHILSKILSAPHTSRFVGGKKFHTALNPPSRFSTQLFAYLFVTKNTAASAISEVKPNLLRGMEFNASVRAAGVIPICLYIRIGSVLGRHKDRLALEVKPKPAHINTASALETDRCRFNEPQVRQNGIGVPFVMSVSIYPGISTLTLIPFSPSSAARARVKPEHVSKCEQSHGSLRH